MIPAARAVDTCTMWTSEPVLSAISDRGVVIERAKALAKAGEVQLALHVIDLLALAPGDTPELVTARGLKAEWLRELAEAATSFVSKSLYLSSANLIEKGVGGSMGVR